MKETRKNKNKKIKNKKKMKISPKRKNPKRKPNLKYLTILLKSKLMTFSWVGEDKGQNGRISLW